MTTKKAAKKPESVPAIQEVPYIAPTHFVEIGYIAIGRDVYGTVCVQYDFDSAAEAVEALRDKAENTINENSTRVFRIGPKVQP